jgi:threonine dehydratase
MEAPVSSLPTVADVEAAARRLAGIALRTPLLTSAALDAMTGGRVFLKAETLQRTGSFKFRGAYNKLASIPPEQRGGGVVAYSSGNHAQGVAAAARLLGMPCVIVMPQDAPRAKRERTAALGAEIVLYDRVRDDREAIASEIATRHGAILVPPYDDALIIAGQGTAGLEIVEDLAARGLTPDVVVVTASGGGLTAGIALAVRARAPKAALYTAEPQGFDDHARSFRSGRREQNAAVSGTICDALMARTPGRLTFAINQWLVGAGVVASDEEVADAVAFAFSELKLRRQCRSRTVFAAGGLSAHESARTKTLDRRVEPRHSGARRIASPKSITPTGACFARPVVMDSGLAACAAIRNDESICFKHRRRAESSGSASRRLHPCRARRPQARICLVRSPTRFQEP